MRARVRVSEPWVSVEEGAGHLGVAKDSIYGSIERRGLRAHKIGRHCTFPLGEIEGWVQTGGAAVDDESGSAKP